MDSFLIEEEWYAGRFATPIEDYEVTNRLQDAFEAIKTDQVVPYVNSYTTKEKSMDELEWEEWYDGLQELAEKHGESVADEGAWIEDFESGKTYDEAFYEEYPEHKS